MNILQEEDIIKGLPDQALFQEAMNPTGQLKQFLVVSEIQRRKEMRKDFEAQQQQDQGTVKDQIVMEAMGIPSVMPPQMASAPKPMGQAGAPPMGAMPPPMGGMPPQGAPPMAPPMPQGGIASAPQAMPPMGMAQGGIVKMSGANLNTGQVPGIPALPAGQFRLFDGSTVADRMAELIARVRRGELAYADVLANISSLPASDARDMALSYVQSEVGGKRTSPPASRPRMEEGMFGYSDRDAGIMGTMESPLPTRDAYPAGQQGREAFSRAFTETLDANDAIFYGQRPTAGVDGGVASVMTDRIDARQKPGVEPAEPIAGILEVAQAVQTDASDPKRGTPGFIPGVTDVDVGFGKGMVGNAGGFGPAMFDSLKPEGGGYLSQLGRYIASEGFDPQLTGRGATKTQVTNQLLGIGPDGPVRYPFGQKKEDAPVAGPAVLGTETATPATPFSLTGENVALIDELSALTAGSSTRDSDPTTQGNKNNAQTQGTGANPPVLDFSDLIAEGKQQALANAMIQLGAGVASGDVAKGLSAAGTAAMKGTADARALDMRRRLAEYQAGREDIRRGEEAERFERQMGLQERKVDIGESEFDERIKVMREEIAAKLGISRNANDREVLQSIDNALKGEIDPTVRADLLEMRQIMSAILSPELMKIMGRDAPTGSGASDPLKINSLLGR